MSKRRTKPQLAPALPPPLPFAGAVAGLLALSALAPALLAWITAQPLDGWPYAVGAAVGAATGYPALAFAARRRPRLSAWPLWVLWLAPPFWGLGGLLLVNRHLDASPPVVHETALVGWRKCTKYRECVDLRSWRGPGLESVRVEPLDAERVRGVRGLPEGATVRVVTRAGRLGWTWVERVRPAR